MSPRTKQNSKGHFTSRWTKFGTIFGGLCVIAAFLAIPEMDFLRRLIRYDLTVNSLPNSNALKYTIDNNESIPKESKPGYVTFSVLRGYHVIRIEYPDNKVCTAQGDTSQAQQITADCPPRPIPPKSTQLHKIEVELLDEATEPDFNIQDVTTKIAVPAHPTYEVGVATLHLNPGTYLIQADYGQNLCTKTVTIPGPEKVTADCPLKRK